MTGLDEPATWRARLPLVVGFLAVLVLVGGLGTWSIGTQIAGAVVASGTVKVESDRQVIQHPDGGVVGAILVREGDAVQAGDVLVRFDNTFLKSELEIVEQQLLEIFVRRARLEAERDGLEALVFDAGNLDLGLDPGWVNEQIAGQESLFAARRASLAQEIELLEIQRAQIENKIVGIDAQISSLTRQRELVSGELSDQQGLLDKGLVTVARVLVLQREEARLEGEIGRLVADGAEARGQTTGIGIEVLRLSDRRAEEAISALRDLRVSESELATRRISLTERLARMDVRSPVDGIVFGSRIFALKSVVQPAEPMMYVVPGDQPLVVSVRIDPIHIDQVFVGQDVSLKFTTFDQRTTPDIAGAIVRISADASVDEITGARFYEATIYPDTGAIAALDGVAVLPGMPVEAFVRTRERTPLSYLTEPLTFYFDRAFREN
jgi:membrane fusion protein, type I secretion system